MTKPKARQGEKKPAKAKAKKPAKPSKTEQLEEAADLLRRIEKAEERCREAFEHLLEAKENIKATKENYNGCVFELRRLCHARKEKLPLFDQVAKTPPAGDAAPQPATAVDDPEILRGKLEDLWHDSTITLTTPEADFIGEVLDGKTKLVGPALDKAVQIVQQYRTIDAAAKPSTEPAGASEPAPVPSLSEAGKPVEDLGISAPRCEKLHSAGLGTVGDLRVAMQKDPRGWYKAVKGIGREAATDIEDRVNAA